MLLTRWRVVTIAVLSLSVGSVVGDDLGQRYTEGLGNVFWMGVKKKKKRLSIIKKPAIGKIVC